MAKLSSKEVRVSDFHMSHHAWLTWGLRKKGGSLWAHWRCFWDYELFLDLGTYVCFIINHPTTLLCLLFPCYICYILQLKKKSKELKILPGSKISWPTVRTAEMQVSLKWGSDLGRRSQIIIWLENEKYSPTLRGKGKWPPPLGCSVPVLGCRSGCLLTLGFRVSRYCKKHGWRHSRRKPQQTGNALPKTGEHNLKKRNSYV